MTYEFYDNGTGSGSPVTTQTVTLSSGGTAPQGNNSAILPAGTYSYIAAYSGDSNYSASTSSCAPFSIGQASTTASLVVDDAGTGSTWVGNEVYGASAYPAATLTVTAPGTGTPTGTVTYEFYDNGTGSGSPVTTQTVTLSSGGTAPQGDNSAILPAGAYSYIAAYSGDSNYSASTSSCAPFSIGQASTTASLAGSVSSAVYGQPVTLAATVAVTAPGTGTPTGTVTFYDGGNQIGDIQTLNGGSANITISDLPVGSDNITASYSGDTNYDTSTSSPALAETISQDGTTTSLAVLPSTQTYDQPVTLTAKVAAVAPGTGTPTGTVTFLDDNNSIGASGLDSSGTATLTTSALAAGVHNSLTADYSGDTDYTDSTSNAVSETVMPAKANQLAWTTQPPATSTVGTGLVSSGSFPAVSLEDPYGNVETSDSSDTVTVSVYGTGGAVLPGSSVTATLQNGVATFNNLIIDQSGDYTLNATCDGFSSTSNSFTITPGAAGGTVLSVSPGSVPGDGNSAATVTAVVYDSYDNPVPNTALTFDADLGRPATCSVSTDVYGSAEDTITSDYAGTATVQVSGGGPTASTQVVFTPTMAVTGLNPDYGPLAGGTPVTVVGTGLSTADAVYFGSVAGTVYGAPTSVSLTVYAPPGPSGGGSVYVVVYGQGGPSAATAAGLYTYYTPVPKPTIDPDGGTFTGSVPVSIKGVPAGDTAYYNLSGDIPTTGSTPYTGLFTLDHSTSVTAAVYDPRYGEWGPAATATFTINPSSGGSGNNGGGHTSPSANNNGTGTLNPSTGGTVWLSSNVGVTIPKGALAGTSNVNVAVQQDNSPPSPPSGDTILGAFDFSVGGQEHYQFNGDVTLAFTFDPAKIPDGETPAVFYYDDATGQWVDIEGTANWTNDTITVTVDHFTKYAVMAVSKTQGASTFSDVPSSYWAYAAISTLSGQGIVSGYPDGTFRPDNTITRAEFVSVMNKALKLQAYNPATPDFTDASPSDWFYGSVENAVYAGIVKGTGVRIFDPNEAITREQLAAILVNALGQQSEAMANMNSKTGFTDDGSISGWARGFVAVAVRDGLLKGYPDGSFRPQGDATRAEACAMIENFLNHSQGK